MATFDSWEALDISQNKKNGLICGSAEGGGGGGGGIDYIYRYIQKIRPTGTVFQRGAIIIAIKALDEAMI